MFTGIVEEIGLVNSISTQQMTISAKKVLEDMKLGESIAINGACLTVSNMAAGNFSVDIMAETAKRTNLKRLHPRSKVNLERAIIIGGRFGGHFVQGHVDDVGRIISMIKGVDAVIARISVPYNIIKYIVKKGFVAVDGCSLTVIDYDDISFSVSLVDYTLKNSILGERKTGDEVNIEVDIIAKYIERFGQPIKNNINPNILQEYKF